MKRQYKQIYRDYHTGKLAMMIHISALTGQPYDQLEDCFYFIMDSLNSMSQRQVEALTYLDGPNCHTLTESSEHVGISERTLRTWRNELIIQPMEEEFKLPRPNC